MNLRITSSRGSIGSKKPFPKDNGLLLKLFPENSPKFSSIKFDSNMDNTCKFYAIDSRGNVLFFDIEKNEYITLYRLGSDVSCMLPVRFSDSKREIFAHANDPSDSLFYIDLDRKKIVSHFRSEHQNPVSNLFFGNSKKIVCSTSKECVNVFKANSTSGGLKKIQKFGSNGKEIYFGRFCNNCSRLLVSLKDGILMWEINKFLRFKYVDKFIIPKRIAEKMENSISKGRKIRFDYFDISYKNNFIIGSINELNCIVLWNMNTFEVIRIMKFNQKHFNGPTGQRVIRRIQFFHTSENLFCVLFRSGELMFIELSTARILFTLSNPNSLGYVKGKNTRIFSNNNTLTSIPFISDFEISKSDRYLLINNESHHCVQLFDMKIFFLYQHDRSINVDPSSIDSLQDGNGVSQFNKMDIIHEGNIKTLLEVVQSIRSVGLKDFLFSKREQSEYLIRNEDVFKQKDLTKKKNKKIKTSLRKYPDELEFIKSKWTIAYTNTMKKDIGRIFKKNVKKNIRSRGVLKATKRKRKMNFDMNKLRYMLLKYGEYPEKYRKDIWSFLLQLPNRVDIFKSLKRKGIHQYWKDIENDYPIKNFQVKRAVKDIINALGHICHVFMSDVGMEITFPFVKSFLNEKNMNVKDMTMCFESILTFFMNWGVDFFGENNKDVENNIRSLKFLDVLLDVNDKELISHFKFHGITSEVYGWNILRSVFTEILTVSDWYKVFDHIFTMPIDFIYFVIVSYLIYFRNTLLYITSKRDFEFFFHRTSPVDLNKVIKMAYKIQKNTFLSQRVSGSFRPFGKIVCSSNAYPSFSSYSEIRFPKPKEEFNRIPENEMSNEFFIGNISESVNSNNRNKVVKSEQDKLFESLKVREEVEKERKFEELYDGERDEINVLNVNKKEKMGMGREETVLKDKVENNLDKQIQQSFLELEKLERKRKRKPKVKLAKNKKNNNNKAIKETLNVELEKKKKGIERLRKKLSFKRKKLIDMKKKKKKMEMKVKKGKKKGKRRLPRMIHDYVDLLKPVKYKVMKSKGKEKKIRSFSPKSKVNPNMSSTSDSNESSPSKGVQTDEMFDSTPSSEDTSQKKRLNVRFEEEEEEENEGEIDLLPNERKKRIIQDKFSDFLERKKGRKRKKKGLLRWTKKEEYLLKDLEISDHTSSNTSSDVEQYSHSDVSKPMNVSGTSYNGEEYEFKFVDDVEGDLMNKKYNNMLDNISTGDISIEIDSKSDVESPLRRGDVDISLDEIDGEGSEDIENPLDISDVSRATILIHPQENI